MKLNGAGSLFISVEVSSSMLLPHPSDDIAWDWVTEKLYWTDECYNHIMVFDASKGETKTLLNSLGSSTRGIAVDPITGYVHASM